VTTVAVWLGVDPGDTRIGVSASDPRGVLAVTVETVPGGDRAVDRILAIAAERGAQRIVVGLALSMSGRHGAASYKSQVFAESLRAATDIPVELFDERLTTVTAERGLRAAGKRPSRSRSTIDQAAATVMLQAALDAARERHDQHQG
jgi:putative Holliday junction resolvase